MKNTVEYWVEISDYDYDTAKAMLDTKRYLYVGFMCHQSIEKILKALFVKIHNDIPPYTHNLRYLMKRCEILDLLSEEQDDFINFLTPLNINNRYPDYKVKINNMMNIDICNDLYDKTEVFRTWIKKKL